MFEIVKTATGFNSTPEVLAPFSGTDGENSYSSLIADSDGNLFGTTSTGGMSGVGTVFELSNAGFAPDTLTFDATALLGVSSDGATDVVLRGTVVGFNPTIHVFNGTTLLGRAVVNGNGTWDLSLALPAGSYKNINAVETDTNGQSATAAASYQLTTAITGQPYAVVEDVLTNGTRSGQTYANTDGSTYVDASYAPDGNGGTLTTFSGGTFFNGLPYASYTTDTDASGTLDAVTQYNADGSTYFAYTITPDASGGGETYDYTGGSAFDGRNYTSYTEHYTASGALEERVLQHVSGGSYSTVAQDVSNGVIVKETFSDFPDASNYQSFFYAFDSAGNLQSQSNTYKGGAHQSQGFRDGVTLTAFGNDTLTGAGQSDTFLFNPGFGHAVVTDFYQHLDGPTHDTISVDQSEFADFATLLADTSNVGGSAVITAQNGDAITLLGVTKAQVAASQTDFVFRPAVS